MKGDDAFCPKTGAPLSEEKHYDEDGKARRAPVDDGLPSDVTPEGELTNGAHCSSTEALCIHFRRTHQQHEAADDSLYRKAALGLRRLKRAASHGLEWDLYVWYALRAWLEESGYDVDWMQFHGEPRCPDCYGPLRYEPVGEDVIGRCATGCNEHNGDRLEQLADSVAELYEEAFDERIDAEDIGLPRGR